MRKEKVQVDHNFKTFSYEAKQSKAKLSKEMRVKSYLKWETAKHDKDYVERYSFSTLTIVQVSLYNLRRGW